MDTIIQTIQMILNQLEKEEKNIELLIDISTDKSNSNKKFKKGTKNISIKLIENKINIFEKYQRDLKKVNFRIVKRCYNYESSIKTLLSKIGLRT